MPQVHSIVVHWVTVTVHIGAFVEEEDFRVYYKSTSTSQWVSIVMLNTLIQMFVLFCIFMNGEVLNCKVEACCV